MFFISDDKLNFIIHEIIYIANDLLRYSEDHATDEEKEILKKYITRLAEIRGKMLTSIVNEDMERY